MGRRTTEGIPLPIELVLDDDGRPPHPEGCDTCDLFGLSVDELGALYRASPPLYRASVPTGSKRPGLVDLACELCGLPTRGTAARRFCSKYCSNTARLERLRSGAS